MSYFTITRWCLEKMALHYNISLHKSNPKNSKRNILTKKKKNKNTLKTKTEDKSLTCPFYVFVAVVVLFLQFVYRMLEDHTKWEHSRAYASRTLSALSGPETIGKSAHGLQGSPRWQVQTRYMSELGDNILRFSFLVIPYFLVPI